MSAIGKLCVIMGEPVYLSMVEQMYHIMGGQMHLIMGEHVLCIMVEPYRPTHLLRRTRSLGLTNSPHPFSPGSGCC